MLEASSKKVFSTMVVALLLSGTAFALASVPGTRAASAPVGIVIPLYSYPTSAAWTGVIQAKASYPNVPFIAVVSPDSGPGSYQDPNFLQGIRSLQGAGVKVLGYVDTAYGSDSLSSVESSVSLWKSLYAPDGIFFDEMSNVPGLEGYYSTLGSYVHSSGMSISMGNPGTSVPDSYIGTLDILNVFESGYYPSLSFITYPGYPAADFALMSYGVGLDTSYIAGASGLVSWVYLTDGTVPNPYSTLPSYFSSEVATLSSLDTGASGSQYTVSVASVDLTGNPLPGLWTTWSQGGPLVPGFTPTSFSGNAGSAYTLSVANYGDYVFCHWQDGGADPTRSVTLAGNQALTAYYSTTGSCPAPAVTLPVTVATDSVAGSLIVGLYATVTQGGSAVANGFSTLTFAASPSQPYTITLQNYGAYTFSHWSDGNTNPTITIVPEQSTTLVAYYNVEQRTG